MPQMIYARLTKYRFQSHAGPPQSLAQIVVLTAPADKAFIEAVNGLEVRTPDAEIGGIELRFRGVPDHGVPPILEPQAVQSVAFGPRNVSIKNARFDNFAIDPRVRLFIQAVAVAHHHCVGTTPAEMRSQMISRENAIAIGK